MKRPNISFKSALTLGINGIGKRPARFTIAVILLAFTLSIVAAAYSAAETNMEKTSLDTYERNGENIVNYSLYLNRRLAETPLMGEDAVKIIEDANPDFAFDKIYSVGSMAVSEFYDQSDLENYFDTYSSGYTDLTDLEKYGMKIYSGRLPEKEGEIALPYYLCETFIRCGYRTETQTRIDITKPEDLLGLTITPWYEHEIVKKSYTIVGAVDTGLDYATYDILKKKGYELDDEEANKANALDNRLYYKTKLSFHTAYFISPADSDFLLNNDYIFAGYFNQGYYFSYFYYGFAYKASEIEDKGYTLRWKNGTFSLASDEILISSSDLRDYIKLRDNPISTPFEDLTDEEMDAKLEEGVYINVNLSGDYVAEANFNISGEVSAYRVAGYWDAESASVHLIAFADDKIDALKAPPVNTVVSMTTTLLGNEKADLRLLGFNGTPYKDGYFFRLNSILTDELESAVIFAANFARIGTYVALAFAAFSFLMMYNFISSSISARVQEIGVLRAMGAGKGMIAAIFSAESLITSLIASAVSVGGAFGLCAALNALVKPFSYDFTFFFMTYRQILVEFALGILIGGAGALIPILTATLGKKPAEILRK
jgi:Predicted ABC-type transport system involved in lysophospholipase L1 biosynthesis, permease component